MPENEPVLSWDRLPMLMALHASGPLPKHAEALATFGRLVGSWDIEDIHFDPDGGVRSTDLGEWHFGWVLEGRAVQDVIFSPRRAELAQDRERRYEYGTTVRLYDPSIDVWHVTFVAPVAGVVVQLLARREDEDIVQTGTLPDGTAVRCVFSEITPETFRWTGYEPADGRRSWVMEDQILATRQAS